MLEIILAVISGYLIGSISFGYILVKLFHKKDIRNIGEKITGGTNVLKNFGKPLGVSAALLDVLKGLLVVSLWFKLTGSELIAVIAGVSALLGHIFPVFLNFRGGKGQSVAIGGLFFFLYKELLIILMIWAVLSFLIKKVYFCGTIAISTFPFLTIYFGQSNLMLFLTVVMVVLRWVAQVKAFKSMKYAEISHHE